MDYNCETCEYSTNDSSNYMRHVKTKKHISKMVNINCIGEYDKSNEVQCKPKCKSNVSPNLDEKSIHSNDKKNICLGCGYIFKHRQSLHKHKKYHCKHIIEDKNKDIEIEELKKQNEELLKLANTNAETANITAKSNKKTVHIMTHAMNNFSDAPEIQQLGHDKSKNLLTNHAKESIHSVEDLMIHNQENKILHKYLGNMLITHYKNTEDPSQQPVWSSDTSRLNFILKQVVGDSSEWVNDKKGIKFNKLVVKPILNKVKDMLLEKIKDLIKKNKKIYMENKEDEEGDDVQENMYKILYCKEIISEITKEILHSEIIKYICPYLNFETNHEKKSKKPKKVSKKLNKKYA
jgi:hypothetical protein